MNKRIIVLLLVLTVLLGVFTLTVSAAESEVLASGTCGENLTWELTNDGNLHISGTGEMMSYNHPLGTPWYSHREAITSVTINDGVSSIGTCAFLHCTNLTSIAIPSSVTSIGSSAFCDSLISVNITDLAAWCAVSFSDYLSNPLCDGASLFLDGKEITTLTIPEGVTSIGDYAFHNYDILTSVTIPEGVTSIGSEAFRKCTNLTSITMSESVTSIGAYAFADCVSLTSVTIPEGVTSIGNAAFFDCIGLTTISIPASVTSIEGDICPNCTNLRGILVDENNPNYSSDEAGVLFDKEKTTILEVPDGISGDYEIPDGVTCIPHRAFWGRPELVSVTIPESVTSIDDEAFTYCGSLTSVTIPEGVTSIGVLAFNGCTSLTDVYYTGTEEQWNLIEIFDYNDPLINATIHFNATEIPPEETKPTEPDATEPTEPDTTDPTEPDVTEPTEPAPTEPTEPAPIENPFADVAEDAYYSAPVLWAVENNITTGVSETSFAPDGTCTRAQIVTFLWRSVGSPAPASSNNPFTDVPAGQWYTDAVLWAVEKGITSGTSATTFSPDAGCTRGQVATFLWRAEHQPASNGSNIFTDITPGAYYYDAVLWAVENGITNGMGNGTFAPDATCTRGQIVTFLYRAMV